MPDRQARLIEAIYRIALEPQTYDSFLDEWEEHMAARLDALQTLRERAADTALEDDDEEIARHVAIAGQLLEHLAERTRAEDLSVEQDGAPRMLADATGRLVWYNLAAERSFGLTRGSSVSVLPLDARHAAALSDLCARLPDTDSLAPPRPLVVQLEDPARGAASRYLQARMLPDRSDGALVLIAKITPDWPDGVARLLTDDFDLSPSECAICELLAEGNGSEQIAALRGSTLATVRTQMKKIMAKTGSHSQVDLIRLLYSLMRIVERHPGRAAPLEPGARHVEAELPDGRVVAAELHGDRDGTPVVFFHGMLDGINFPPEFERMLAEAGFRLICPVRPYYGSAEPAPGPALTAAERFAADVTVLLGHLDVGRALLLGHMAGALHAHTLAARTPATARGILSVAGAVPLTSSRHYARMSRRQRLVALTARHAPHLLPFLLRAGVSQMMNGGQERFIRQMYRDTPDDLAAIADPATFARIAAGHRFSVRQGHRAFEIDGQQLLRDWSGTVDASDVPIHALHGADDPAMSVQAVRDFFSQRTGRATVEVIDRSGQLILHRRPEAVVAALIDLRRRL